MKLPQRVMEVHGGLLWQAGLIWRPGQWNVTDGCVKWLTKGWVQQGQTGHRDDHYSALLKCVYVFILFYFIFIVVLASVLRDSWHISSHSPRLWHGYSHEWHGLNCNRPLLTTTKHCVHNSWMYCICILTIRSLISMTDFTSKALDNHSWIPLYIVNEIYNSVSIPISTVHLLNQN